jgi:hypothetical protein
MKHINEVFKSQDNEFLTEHCSPCVYVSRQLSISRINSVNLIDSHMLEIFHGYLITKLTEVSHCIPL